MKGKRRESAERPDNPERRRNLRSGFQEKDLPPLVAIVGPTGAGKSALALALGERFRGEIVNCDSIALYREFEIGSAKPSPEGRRRAPHHLLDVLEPTAASTAGDYARRAREVLAEIRERGALPIVAGGTGLYLRALLEGLFPGPQRSHNLRVRLRERGRSRAAGYLHRLLVRLDAEAAKRIHANDEPKVIRAIEVSLTSRRPMSELWQQGREPLRGFRVLKIGLAPERHALYARINQRARQMFDAGLIEETRRLYRKYGERALPLAAPGYKQAMQYIRGEIDHKLAVWAAQQAHRNYAKRQMTWFRREPEVHWINGFGDEPRNRKKAELIVQERIRDG